MQASHTLLAHLELCAVCGGSRSDAHPKVEDSLRHNAGVLLILQGSELQRNKGGPRGR